MPSTPAIPNAQVTVTCRKPDDYAIESRWEDNKWLKGYWDKIKEVTECFDPFRCYADKGAIDAAVPKLPDDYSVSWNISGDPPKDAPVNTSILYKCDKKCELRSTTTAPRFK